MEIIAQRQFDPLYIWLDIAFLVLFAALLIWKKKYMTVLVGIAFGFIYFAVDYGLFHLVFHARSITGGSLFCFTAVGIAYYAGKLIVKSFKAFFFT